MPVDFEAYSAEGADEAGLRMTEGTNAYAILQFLADHREQGFTPKEIAAATNVLRGSVGATLARLERRGLVRHKEPYWAVAADDRLAAYAAMLHGFDAAAERFGDENWSGWKSEAVDPRLAGDDG